MYTDQFKTKESLVYYAFDILKSIAKRCYNLKYDELKETLIIYVSGTCKITITANNDKIIPKGFQTFNSNNDLICSYGGYNCGIQPLFKDVEEYIKEHFKKYEQLTLF